ncbi:MAG: hypothetical protein ABF295_09055 [Flavobacteriaceae bacterium]
MSIKGKVIQGHGVASGKVGDPRYPEGTLIKQLPFFKALGLDLGEYHLGTINLDIHPYRYGIIEAFMFFSQVRWSEHIPAENFYFFTLTAHYKSHTYNGLIYMPDPETKVEHEQSSSTLELILPKIKHLDYGDILKIEVPDTQLRFLQ